MAKLSNAVPLAPVSLDAASNVPLYRQVYDDLRRAILKGQLKAGTRLPSTRELAAELGVSRNTVMNAFEQLLAEGYLEGRTGSGTFVSKALPEELFGAREVGAARVITTRRVVVSHGRQRLARGRRVAPVPSRLARD